MPAIADFIQKSSRLKITTIALSWSKIEIWKDIVRWRLIDALDILYALVISYSLLHNISVCGLLMPSESRQAYFALRAFNVEIANIKDASRSMGRSRVDVYNDEEFMTGDSTLASRLRMQWWKDGIKEVYDRKGEDDDEQSTTTSSSSSSDPILRSLTSSRKQNPIMRSLSRAIYKHDLTHRFLRRIMEARENDLDVMQYEKCTDVAQYGEDTISSLLYLSFETVGVSE